MSYGISALFAAGLGWQLVRGRQRHMLHSTAVAPLARFRDAELLHVYTLPEGRWFDATACAEIIARAEEAAAAAPSGDDIGVVRSVVNGARTNVK